MVSCTNLSGICFTTLFVVVLLISFKAVLSVLSRLFLALLELFLLVFSSSSSLVPLCRLSPVFLLLQSAPDPPEPTRFLDWVLAFLCSPHFTVYPSACNIFLKAVFLLALSSGCRVGSFRLFSGGGILFSFDTGEQFVHLQPSTFLFEEELADVRRGPFGHLCLVGSARFHHLLFWVAALCCCL